MDSTEANAFLPSDGNQKSSTQKVSSYLEKMSRINLDFTDLSYTVTSPSKNKEKKILQEISGSFKSGELTAILGTSGAGKSTLLNILTGYVSHGITGSIKVNGHPYQKKVFSKLSRYIMQDDFIQPYLTVEESLMSATDLKLGKGFSREEKSQVVKEILEILGLTACRHTRTENLSGGQIKRVSIALEMVNNPPVIFLDEPTTGLDVVSTSQLMKFLQKLARQGRTVICTIHQPSASVCSYFDHMYIMAHGHCVYQGPYQQLVPFMSFIGFECPITHNPTDFVVEIIQSGTIETVNRMSQALQNGKLSLVSVEEEAEADEGNLKKIHRNQKSSTPLPYVNENLRHPVRFSGQFVALLRRKLKQQFRNMIALSIMLLHHIMTGIFLGLLFQKVGNDASRPFENFKFLISVVVFFMYTHVMCPILLLPMDIKYVRREYFNRWYGLRAYFAVLSVSTIPFQLFFGVIFILFSYIIADQPLVLSKMVMFYIIAVLVGLTSEGWGLTIGSLFSIKNGSIVGPASTVPILAVSVYGMGFGAVVEPIMQFFMSISYLRYGLVGLTTTIYGQNRTLICDYDKTMHCQYLKPKLLLKDLGMAGANAWHQILILLCFFALYRLTAFLALRYQLSFQFSYKIRNFISKVSLLCKKKE